MRWDNLASAIGVMKRIYVEVGTMIVLMALLFVFNLSAAAPMGVALFLYKALLFSASQVHAMILRKVFFPYLDFATAETGSKALVIVLHIMAAYVYAQGG